VFLECVFIGEEEGRKEGRKEARRGYLTSIQGCKE
jgi:hypothetical protein